MEAGANVRQNAYTAGATHQQWEVRPVDTRIGGDLVTLLLLQHTVEKLSTYSTGRSTTEET